MGSRALYQRKRTLFTLKTAPALLKHDKFDWMIVSMPQMAFLTKRSVEDLLIKNLLIWVDTAEADS